jgi:hypothetical protein
VAAVSEYPTFDDTLTKNQLAELRGGLSGAGAGDMVSHHSNGATAVVEDVVPRTCDECGKELTGGRVRWCSTACKKRNEYRRSKGRTPAAVPSQTQRPTAVRPDLFETLQGLPVLLRAGWTAEVTSSAVSLHWTP